MFIDLLFDFNKLDSEQKQNLNKNACNYGMKDGDFVRMLRKERDEKEMLKAQKALEAEKAQYSGRKSRRERRLAKERRLIERGLGPLSYKAADDNKSDNDTSGSEDSSRRRRRRSRSRSSSRSRSRSRSKSTDKNNKIVFISSFGGANSDEDLKNSASDDAFKLLNLHQKRNSSLSALKTLKRDLSMSPPPVEKKIEVPAINRKLIEKNDDSDESLSSNDDDEMSQYLKRKQERLA